MIGRKASREEIKARWAFSELRTERGKDLYANLHPQRIRDGIPFERLSAGERQHLVWMTERGRANLVLGLAADYYECDLWTKERLGRAYTLSGLAPDRKRSIPFLSFVASPRFRAGPNSEFFAKMDPRVQADMIPFDNTYRQEEPIIVARQNAREFLIDGYLRGILFLRDPDPDARIMVWVPASTET